MENLGFVRVLKLAMGLVGRHWVFFCGIGLVTTLLNSSMTLIAASPPTNIPVLYLWVCLSTLVACWAHGASIHFAGQALGGTAPDARQALVGAFRRWPQLMWTCLVSYFWIMLGLLLLIVPGILWGFRQMLAQVVTVLEAKSGPAALRRSQELIAVNSSLFGGIAIGQLLLMGVLVSGPAFLLQLQVPHSSLELQLAFNLLVGLLNSLIYAIYTSSLVVLFQAFREQLDSQGGPEIGVGFSPFSS